ncbi:MAG: crossover junction endodeoxyribonuclease RuvC [Candidatus Marinimicrobia bacterium]|jgi:crossover junction endodeoxyribonuclease RuvC|nr:crossover junction endodeoxyribonuclease RuvC [Candidatus Neomarinimicrobiota bacterium]MBT3496784.1 crossover junction endodeoxyribonuclease RuvC [Candidatus Neomarinimicrobiota bacterium]MBT3691803.1 crossover junction endodeoxyribonuclease RuvC [Candidatus Neomarinimicrobiota bacterium]MBT3731714.1 crossover junction endodeoxyribonuclease RuvC [Candidatus Neomarinimicrobiota bacterium]MBT4143798.1 crossover junction endodeoxyribonuclease RuvC [Candidatus Neomarinimicrobiota bacterium]
MSVVRVIGIDPGIGTTGFGILDGKGGKTRLHSYGTIKPPAKDSIELRLKYLYSEVQKLIHEYKPSIMAIEDSFYSKNVKSALTLGQARGALILAAVNADINVRQYAPRKVKQSVVGNGAASKEQVQFMVTQILKLKEAPESLDISDAIAIALTYYNQAKFEDL